MRVDWYPECETCEQYGKRYCVGCMPMLMSDGRYTRTGYVPKDGGFTYTYKVTSSPVHTEQVDK